MCVIYNRRTQAWLASGAIPTTNPSRAFRYESELDAQQHLQFLNSRLREMSCVLREIKVKGYIGKVVRRSAYYQFDGTARRHPSESEMVTVFSSIRELESVCNRHQLTLEAVEVTV